MEFYLLSKGCVGGVENGMSYLEVKNLYKAYRHKKVLQSFAISVEQGEMVAIMGRSGCGKSTLLHILSGIEKMDSGTYVLDGQDLSNCSSRKMAILRNEMIGYIMQSYALIPSITAYENIVLPLQMRKLIGDETYSIVESVARKLDITSLLDQKTRDLSGGEKQRVAIARALVIQPKVILADEPTGALDQESAAELMQLLCSLQKEGNTIILVTHDRNVAGYCNQIYHLQDGRIQNEKTN